MEKLISELKQKIVDTLGLTDVTPEDINEQDQLIGGPLGLDSIDVLEMVMMLENDYGVVIDNKELGETVFSTLDTLARYVNEHGKLGS
ncbi:acyl carrier protein [Desulfobacter hydrogenophilus]|uniref:Acyl carrier protein n=1 Tax=Desulfobacter hydrogenophilus TaxID=2291 RepID=A0A328F9I4_9BACT|nr:phosphopantetheine-binding protein [Desulfobacter hydrogenophilus]NDY72598.1 acyl carrier protein [Desulfobacter hydrogenophilus]QBH13319.1 acyl carrier protein [Desulfobacter hydrogenophilus]RAM01281.1 acyl carrier protein [Desulfobacter hydrogenophilus]